MRPAQVLDCHADLLARMQNIPQFMGYISHAAALDATNGGAAEDVRLFERSVVEPMRNAVRTAYAFHVNSDMSLMVQHAGDQLDDTDTFSRQEAPTGSGICHFERGLPLPDVRGKTMLIHWVVWGPVSTESGPGTLAMFFNDTDVEPDGILLQGKAIWSEWDHEKVRRIIGRWSWVGVSVGFEDEPLGPRLREASPEHAARLEAEGVVVMPSGNPLRYVKALWMLLDQTITTVTEEDVDRATRRRMGKVNLPARVSVVKLRRSKNSDRPEGESLVEWSFRWVVRGHWRWQPYGTRGADHEHAMSREGKARACQHPGCDRREERIWINPYVKGPDDMPLAVSDKVYSLER